MKNLIKTGMILAMLTLISLVGYAQKGIEDGSKYGKGQDSINCMRNYSLYREFLKQNNYKDAKGHWVKCFSECPTSFQNIYIEGVKIYKYFADNEKNPIRKGEYIDTLLLIYDRRIQYFGQKQKASILGRKGVDMLVYASGNIQKTEAAFKTMEESFNTDPSVSEAVISSYISAGATLYKESKLDAIAILDKYSAASDKLDAMLKSKPGDASILNTKASIDGSLRSLNLSCEVLENAFAPKLKANPNDTVLLAKIANFMGDSRCYDSPTYLSASESLYKLNPSANSAYTIAQMNYNKKNYSKAVEYYKEAAKLENDKDRLGNIYYEMAVCYSQIGQKSAARESAQNAISNKSNWGKPYILIGILYASSNESCKSGDCDNNVVFWAAVDKFIKARNVDSDPETSKEASEYISRYSQYFPDKESAFFCGLSDGQSYTVGCWINETTTVRTRK